MDKKIAEALGRELKKQLLSGNSVQIKGLGNFSVIHHKQSQEQDPSGRVVLLPPADRLKFTPEG